LPNRGRSHAPTKHNKSHALPTKLHDLQLYKLFHTTVSAAHVLASAADRSLQAVERCKHLFFCVDKRRILTLPG